jgi:23S rRNA pseudouridine2605 synthase
LADAGVSSRRGCKELVLSGKIRVNGVVAFSQGIQIDPEKDIIEVDGRHIEPDKEKVYILLNKPHGYLSTTSDEKGRKTVIDLLPIKDKRLYPVGRLDLDTEGLLIITNDGELTYLLTHPKHNINKVYLAWLNDKPTDKELDKLRIGIMLEDGMTAPALVERERDAKQNCMRITIHEGRKRQVKRMFSAIGYEVLRLKRIKIGSIELGKLPPGKFRYLLPEEVKALRNPAKNGKK